MGGSAVSRIYAENKINMEIYQKGQMDVGRTELLTKADLISNTLILQLLRRFSLLKVDLSLIFRFLQKIQVITEEKISSIKQREVEKYRTDNYEIWLGLRETLSRIPEWRVPLNRVVIWVDPLDATQEYTGRLINHNLQLKNSSV
jgi:3'-phosphoadenosine 5'-phosphosulfate (PAPS) 3'-phosphatase